MTWVSLSMIEWRRRPLRTSITAAGVAIAVAGLFSLLAFHKGYRAGISRELDRLGAHILVVPKGCPYDAASMALHGATWPCYLRAQYLDEVRGAPGVASAAPAFMNALYDERGQTVYVGIDDAMRPLRPGWKVNGTFPSNTNELLIGSEVAWQNGWQVGASVRLPGFGKAEHHGRISGIIEPTHSSEDSFIFIRLADAQRLFNHHAELSHILVRLTDPSRLDEAVNALRGCDAGMDMNVVPLAHLFRTIQSLVNSTRTWLFCVALIGLLIAAAGVSSSLLMAVSERMREIGVMRALGASRADIFRLFCSETIQVCAVGGGAGVLLAFAGSRAVESWLRGRLPFAPVDALIEWQWGVVAICFIVALGVGVIAGLAPAWRAAQMAPDVAIRAGGVV